MYAAACSSFPAIAAVEPVVSPISVQTALLLILGLGLLFVAKSLVELNRRVDALTARTRPKKIQRPENTAGALSPEIVAVISAAVFEVIEADHRIVSISTNLQDNANWSQEGRRQVFAGRKVR